MEKQEEVIYKIAQKTHGWCYYLIFFIVGTAVLGLLSFVVLVGYYRYQIEQGKTEQLSKQFNNSLLTPAVETNVAHKRAELESESAFFLGNPEAETVIVEFVDFKCPNCKENSFIMKKVMEKYGYKVKMVSRYFPVESNYPGSTNLSMIAFCAGEQGRYWEMYDLLFANQESLPVELGEADIKVLANQALTDFDKIKACLSNNNSRVRVNQDYSTGIKYGVRGTPTFFVDGEKVAGVISFADWDKFLSNL